MVHFNNGKNMTVISSSVHKNFLPLKRKKILSQYNCRNSLLSRNESHLFENINRMSKILRESTGPRPSGEISSKSKMTFIKFTIQPNSCTQKQESFFHENPL